MESPGTVACVVITYNSEDVLGACLRACYAQAEILGDLEIVVVDNASTDGTVAVARNSDQKRLKIIANSDNRGFAAAVNQGIANTTSDFILVLNPDVQLLDPVGPLVNACREYGLASGRLVDAEGHSQAGFTIRRFPSATVLSLELLGINRLWPGNPWNQRYRYLDQNLEQDAQVDQPAGAFLMLRKDVWKTLHGLDETFWPVWFEDVDFCIRASQAGFSARYVSSVRAVHAGGHSIQKIDGASRELYWYDSLLRYAFKHMRPRGYRAVCLAAVVSVAPRMILNILRQRSLRPISTGFQILYFSGKRLVSA